MKSTFFAFLLSLLCLTAFSQTDENKVLQKVKELNDAIFVRKDGSAIQALVMEKLSYGHSDGKVEDKPTMVRNAATNKITYQNVETLLPRIAIEQNTAVARHYLKGIQTDSTGKPGPLTLEVLQVWFKDNGEWKLLARQAVKVPVKN